MYMYIYIHIHIYIYSGGSRISRRGACTHWGGHGPPTWALFGENVCKNKRIGSHRGACAGHAAPRSANVYIYIYT